MPAASAQVDVPQVDVLIVGGGPVGLTARALLERWGVRTLLVEKHVDLSPFPRSRLVNVRTMEIYRGLGLTDKIRAAAFAPEFGRVRFRDTLYDQDFATAAMVGVNAPVPESPAIGLVTSQDRLEPTLLAAAQAPVRFGSELVDLAEDAEGVVAVLTDRQSGEGTRVRARYVIAADGANSTVRQLLAIGTAGPGELGSFTTVVFDADLGPWSVRQPAGVYFTPNGSFGPVHPGGSWSWFAPTPEDAARADWPELVSRALGPGADVRAEVLRVQHWAMNAFVAERFRRGRVLLAGDAAHAIPPIGGLGMNTGVADVHNLCWKLAGVIQGWAGADLLETYAAEREPVAQRTLRQAVANTRLMVQVLTRRREQADSAEGVMPDRLELPWSEGYFAQLGLVLGVAYRSGAVLAEDAGQPERADGADRDGPDRDGVEYVPTAEPGHRMPHLWLTRDRSTLDAFGEWFTLLTPDPVHWERQITAVRPLRIEALPAEHADLCGLGPHGALLVRPDGHIGARWRDRPPSGSALGLAVAAITGSPARA